MNIQKTEERILYVPNTREGIHLFNGEPTASQKVLSIISQEGIDHIDNRLKNFLDQGIERYGYEHRINYGFHPHQRFFDVQEQILINVKAVISEKEEKQNYSITLAESHSDIIWQNFLKSIKETEGVENQIAHIKRFGLRNPYRRENYFDE
ncbi:hypothetical protein [Tenacibaculum sp. M341]|uniref:hypothetical protein n=1 Tax=Tenacibaculum sp. M341 TaxID=2530339 RepID=UPI00104DDA15|nr:hypothetical protein [Tenacibaculum sp. M341]TCI93584.1 hypothetical protein EYW44_04020 [Tenacibaculum sp. M341]